MSNLLSFIKTLYLLIFVRDYFIFVDECRPWAFVSYLSEPLYNLSKDEYFDKHQNRREAVIIAKSFEELGYNVHVRRFDKPIFLNKRKYNVVFGLEPNFETVAKKNPLAVKIYYATGAFWKYQNESITSRTLSAREVFKFNFEMRRLVTPHNSCSISDHIFQIGNKNTISTYPYDLHSKIKLIRQSNTLNPKKFLVDEKIKHSKINEFVWFGSSGTILKGLDLILPIFAENANLKLNIVGKLDDDFLQFFNERFSAFPQIKYHGYLNINSSELYTICMRSMFILFPSCSEGGLPGSLINMMRLGLIPITSKVCSVDNMSDFGYTVDLDSNCLSQVINLCLALSPHELDLLIHNNVNFILENYNLDVFCQDFKRCLTEVIN